ncbi:unnamed protein product, partial [Ectocarpus sp. 12 AP-2014]
RRHVSVQVGDLRRQGERKSALRLQLPEQVRERADGRRGARPLLPAAGAAPRVTDARPVGRRAAAAGVEVGEIRHEAGLEREGPRAAWVAGRQPTQPAIVVTA